MLLSFGLTIVCSHHTQCLCLHTVFFNVYFCKCIWSSVTNPVTTCSSQSRVFFWTTVTLTIYLFLYLQSFPLTAATRMLVCPNATFGIDGDKADHLGSQVVSKYWYYWFGEVIWRPKSWLSAVKKYQFLFFSLWKDKHFFSLQNSVFCKTSSKMSHDIFCFFDFDRGQIKTKSSCDEFIQSCLFKRKKLQWQHLSKFDFWSKRLLHVHNIWSVASKMSGKLQLQHV